MVKLKNHRFFIFPTHRKAKIMEKVRKRSERKSYETEYTEFVTGYRKIYRLLSPNRMDILFLLRYRDELTISEIADEVFRNYKNVYTDVKMLEEAGFVKLRKEKGKVYVSATVSTITLKFFFAPDENSPEPIFYYSEWIKRQKAFFENV
ncbi:HVO_A0114 family putative DNA-binding protein [Desulfurobacterium sp.]